MQICTYLHSLGFQLPRESALWPVNLLHWIGEVDWRGGQCNLLWQVLSRQAEKQVLTNAIR
jgi:hypothetical protein